MLMLMACELSSRSLGRLSCCRAQGSAAGTGFGGGQTQHSNCWPFNTRIVSRPSLKGLGKGRGRESQARGSGTVYLVRESARGEKGVLSLDSLLPGTFLCFSQLPSAFKLCCQGFPAPEPQRLPTNQHPPFP